MARTNAKVSSKALNKCATRHAWTLQWCWNYERMQASGMAYALAPVMEELYDNEDEVCENLERHMQFYNTHPTASAVILGAAAALEADYQPQMAESIKVALMGPLAGIGDTIQGVLVQPLAYMLAAGLAQDGSYLALPMILIPFLILFILRWPLFHWGYRRSVAIIEDVSGASDFNTLQDAASMLGMTVVGGFVPSMVGVSLAYTYTKEMTDDAGEVVTKTVALQDTLDGILPYLLPICMVAFCYWLIKKVKLSPIKVICILAVIAFVLGALGILG